MATANAAATLARADSWETDFAGEKLEILSGANVLVEHTIGTFTTSNSGNDALATSSAIADETITGAGTQTADGARISDGTKVYELTVDTAANPSIPPADLRLTTLTYINGETSSIDSLVATFKS